MLDANDLKAIREIMLESENRINERIDKLEASTDKRFNKVDEELKELHHMDTLILDEVERVHGIFAKKTEELEKKIG